MSQLLQLLNPGDMAYILIIQITIILMVILVQIIGLQCVWIIPPATYSVKVEAEDYIMESAPVILAKDETKLMLDVDERLFSRKKIDALQDDLDFIFGSYEVKRR